MPTPPSRSAFETEITHRPLPKPDSHLQPDTTGSAAGPLLPRWSEALALWLRWNEAYEQTTARMFQARHDPKKLKDLMDHMDQLRGQAIALSRQLLESDESLS